MTCYRFAEVSAALREHWGLALYRGGEMGDGKHDGRWDVTYSRTGFVVYGDLPGRGHGGVRYATLARVVTTHGIAEVIERFRSLETALHEVTKEMELNKRNIFAVSSTGSWQR